MLLRPATDGKRMCRPDGSQPPASEVQSNDILKQSMNGKQCLQLVFWVCKEIMLVKWPFMRQLNIRDETVVA